MFKVYKHDIVLNNKGGNHKVTLVINGETDTFYACPKDWCICIAKSDDCLYLSVSKEPKVGDPLYVIYDPGMRIVFGGTRHCASANDLANAIRQNSIFSPIVRELEFGKTPAF